MFPSLSLSLFLFLFLFLSLSLSLSRGVYPLPRPPPGALRRARPRFSAGRPPGYLGDHAAPHLLDRVGAGEFHVMDPAIDAVDDEIDPLAHLVASQPLADHPADDVLAGAQAAEDILVDAALVGEAVVRQRGGWSRPCPGVRPGPSTSPRRGRRRPSAQGPPRPLSDSVPDASRDRSGGGGSSGSGSSDAAPAGGR